MPQFPSLSGRTVGILNTSFHSHGGGTQVCLGLQVGDRRVPWVQVREMLGNAWVGDAWALLAWCDFVKMQCIQYFKDFPKKI